MEYRTLLSSKEGSSKKVNKIKILKKMKETTKVQFFTVTKLPEHLITVNNDKF